MTGPSKLTLAILGTGRVGRSIGKGLKRAGHQIIFGSRAPEAFTKAGMLVEGARFATVADAVKAAEVVVLAVPYTAVIEVLGQAGDMSGRILIDCTNPFASDRSSLTIGRDDSAAEMIARCVPEAAVVKAFNHIGWEHLGDRIFAESEATLFMCGDEGPAKQVVAGLIGDLGYEAVDTGPLDRARLLEPLGLLWSVLAREEGLGRGIALRLLRAPRLPEKGTGQ